jgi:hypothetical protein
MQTCAGFLRFRFTVVSSFALLVSGCASAANTYNAEPVTASTGTGGGVAMASHGAVSMNATGGPIEADPNVSGVGLGGDGTSGASASHGSSASASSSAPDAHGSPLRPRAGLAGLLH